MIIRKSNGYFNGEQDKCLDFPEIVCGIWILVCNITEKLIFFFLFFLVILLLKSFFLWLFTEAISKEISESSIGSGPYTFREEIDFKDFWLVPTPSWMTEKKFASNKM